jgi:hypothetical protein
VPILALLTIAARIYNIEWLQIGTMTVFIDFILFHLVTMLLCASPVATEWVLNNTGITLEMRVAGGGVLRKTAAAAGSVLAFHAGQVVGDYIKTEMGAYKAIREAETAAEVAKINARAELAVQEIQNSTPHPTQGLKK